MGQSLTSYFLGKVCLAHNLEPKIPEESLVIQLSYHYDDAIQKARRYRQVKTIQSMASLLGDHEHEGQYRRNRIMNAKYNRNHDSYQQPSPSMGNNNNPQANSCNYPNRNSNNSNPNTYQRNNTNNNPSNNNYYGNRQGNNNNNQSNHYYRGGNQNGYQNGYQGNNYRGNNYNCTNQDNRNDRGNNDSRTRDYRPQVNYIQSRNQGSQRRYYSRSPMSRNYYSQASSDDRYQAEGRHEPLENNPGNRSDTESNQPINSPENSQ